MAAVEFQIIYLDRRAREEGVYTRDNRPKRSGRGARTGPSASTSHYNISSSADEVDDNVNQLLEHFEKGRHTVQACHELGAQKHQ
jgi:hypothetical protein